MYLYSFDVRELPYIIVHLPQIIYYHPEIILGIFIIIVGIVGTIMSKKQANASLLYNTEEKTV